MDVRYQLEDTLTRGLAQLSDAVAAQALSDAALAGAQVVVNRAVERLSIQSWESGDLGRSMHALVVEADASHAVAEAAANREYAVFVEYGTGIYGVGEGATRQPIRPKTGKFLRWVGKDGQVHFAREVKGMEPRPFLRPALDESHDQVLEAMGNSIQNALKAGPR